MKQVMPQFSLWLERVFTVLAGIITAGAIIPLLQSGGGEDIPGVLTSWQLMALSVVYALLLLLLLPRLSSLLNLLSRQPLLVAFMLFMLASSLWAELPGAPLLGAIAATLTSLLGCYVVARFSIREYLLLTGWTLGILAVLSLFFAVFLPFYGQHATGSWRGVFINRNTLASLMGIAVWVYAWMAMTGKRARLLSFGMMLLCALILWQTGSRTALVSLVVMIAECFALAIIYRSGFSRAMFTTLLLLTLLPLAGWLLSAHWEALLEILGREPDLSGRTERWEEVLLMAWERPWLGFGSLGFADDIIAPHNTLLVIWLESGLIGVTLFLLMILAGFVRSIVVSRALPSPERYLYPTLLSFLMIRGITEALYFTTYHWLLMVILVISPTVELARRKATNTTA